MPLIQVGVLMLYLGLGYAYVISGLVVPMPFLLLLWMAWGALFVIGLRKRNDFRFLAGVPVIAAILWAAVVLGLGSLLEWEA